MNSFALILPVLLIMILLTGVLKLSVFLFDVIADMREDKWLPESSRMARTGLAIILVGVLAVLGGLLVRVLISLA